MNAETQEDPSDGALMALIPAGHFLMGLPDNDLLAEEHEKPQRLVFLRAFWIDVYPVTNSRFARFVEAGGYSERRWWSPAGWVWRESRKISAPLTWGEPGWDAPEQPVAGVSWFEAEAYCRWADKRLPSDAEWEKAARGSDGRRYPWGNDWPSSQHCNFDSRVGRTTPVGLYPLGVSPFGLHDMAGNVNNWCLDWYWVGFGQYCAERRLLNNPLLDDATRESLPIADEIVHKVDRGGGFGTAFAVHEVVGCTRKVYWKPGSREPWNGFRTVRDVS